jgi:hypothetical protein
MFYFPIDFVVSVERLGCTRVVCKMNSEWSSQNGGETSLILDYETPQMAQGVYESINENI